MEGVPSRAARRTRRHFDESAPYYDQERARRDPSYRRLLQGMVWLLDLPRDRPAHILELGVGTGNQTRLLLREFPEARVTGYDLSPAMLARARRKLAPFGERARLIEADFSAGLTGGPYAAVLSANAIHHVPRARQSALWERLFSLLRPGGQVIIAEPFWPPGETLRDLYWGAQRRALADAGVEVRDHDRELARRSRHSGHGVTVTEYLARLRRAGFVEVDCPWREWGRAIVHARRPLT